MSRLFALAFAISITVSTIMPAGAQASPDVIVADLDTFWASQFGLAGREYWSPAIVVLDQPVSSSCGVLSSDFGPGAYCGADATLYYAPVWFSTFETGGHEFASLTVLAHEWGHHVQLLLGIGWSPSKEYELQADCLAGVYAHQAEQEGLAPAGALADAIRLSALSGDTGPLPLDAPEHGSGAERAISFMNGYDAGVAGCGITL